MRGLYLLSAGRFLTKICLRLRARLRAALRPSVCCARSLAAVKAKGLGDETKRPSLSPESPRARSSQGRRKELRLCSQAATRALSSTCALGGEEAGERRRGGVSSSGIRVTGLQASCLTSSALVKRGVQRLDLEKQPDLDVPELVDVAQADAVRV